MALDKKFLHPKTSSLGISKSRFWVALVLGGLYSFIFYSLLYMFREVFRVLSMISNDNLLVLSDSETGFYNLFFGFVSAIVGQSIAFQFLFEKPGKLARRGKRGLYRMFHDQRFFTWFVLSWYSRVAIIFSSIFIITFDGGHFALSLYGNYNYLFDLIILVLFFQSWNGAKQLFKRKAYKWMLVSAVTLSVLAFGLSRINWVNYDTINTIGLKDNVYYHYNLKLPEGTSPEKIRGYNIIDNIYLVQPKNQLESEPKIFIEKKEVSFLELRTILKETIQINSFKNKKGSYLLHIDQSIDMVNVNRLKREFSNCDIRQIIYSILPKDRKYDDGFYKNWGIMDKLTDLRSTWFDYPNFYSELIKEDYTYIIEQDDLGAVEINGEEIDNSRIKNKIKELIRDKQEYVMVFEVNKNIKFSDYIKILDLTRSAVHDLRNEKAKEKYYMNFDDWDLGYEKEKEIRELVPYRFIEITSEIRKLAPSSSSGA